MFPRIISSFFYIPPSFSLEIFCPEERALGWPNYAEMEADLLFLFRENQQIIGVFIERSSFEKLDVGGHGSRSKFYVGVLKQFACWRQLIQLDLTARRYLQLQKLPCVVSVNSVCTLCPRACKTKFFPACDFLGEVSSKK